MPFDTAHNAMLGSSSERESDSAAASGDREERRAVPQPPQTVPEHLTGPVQPLEAETEADDDDEFLPDFLK